MTSRLLSPADGSAELGNKGITDADTTCAGKWAATQVTDRVSSTTKPPSSVHKYKELFKNTKIKVEASRKLKVIIRLYA